MMELDGRLAVRVGILLPLGMHDLRHTSQIGVEQHSAGAFLALDETLFLFGQACLIALLLQDNQVTAHFEGAFITPCEVMNANTPPSRSISTPLTKK